MNKLALLGLGVALSASISLAPLPKIKTNVNAFNSKLPPIVHVKQDSTSFQNQNF